MSYQIQKLEKLTEIVKQHTPQEGINTTAIESLGTYRSSTAQDRQPEIDIPAIVIALQGKKICYIGDQSRVYHAGKVLIGFYPTPLEAEIVDATPEAPYLAVGVALDLSRMADMLLKIDRVDETVSQPAPTDLPAKIAIDLSNHMLDSFIRLFETLGNPRDTAILSDLIIEEIYYRLLSGERGNEIRELVQQKGKIQRISKAIDHICTNLDQPVSVKKLADIVHMSESAFYLNFKEVMQVSPLQYAKSVKLFEAQKLIKEGKRVSEASFMVGYNNLSQFGREYKRMFGYSPSAT